MENNKNLIIIDPPHNIYNTKYVYDFTAGNGYQWDIIKGNYYTNNKDVPDGFDYYGFLEQLVNIDKTIFTHYSEFLSKDKFSKFIEGDLDLPINLTELYHYINDEYFIEVDMYFNFDNKRPNPYHTIKSKR